MTLRYVVRPMVWIGESTPPRQRRRGGFSAPWSQTMRDLGRELRHLNAHNIVIGADFREQDLRLDGLPRSGARQPAHPGVKLMFDSTHGPLSYATDTYQNWQHNARAIALGLEALRAVDRYGITQAGEQYKGFRAITSGGDDSVSNWTQERAAKWLSQFGPYTDREILADSKDYRDAYRNAAVQLHPDVGGTAEEFQKLQQVRDLLEKTA